MPELKRNFSQAKMNKDLDERLIPNGQYRDATNIQISTSDDSNVGSAQTLLGNTIKNTIENGIYSVPTTSTCIGSVGLPETDKIYYMVSAGINTTTGATLPIQRDYILEYDTLKRSSKYVFVDIYGVSTKASTTVSNSVTIKIPDGGSSTINKTGVRAGMTFTHSSVNINDEVTVADIAYDAGNSRWTITLSSAVSVSGNDDVFFVAPRILNFNRNSIITGINVLDDFLFWTDGINEPKKINIKRSIAGTGGEEYLQGGGIAGFNPSPTNAPTTNIFEGDTHDFHTRLVADRDGNSFLEIVTDRTGKKAVYVEEKNITVIKKSPTQPLTLEMSDQKDPRINNAGDANLRYTSASINFTDVDAGDEISPDFDTPIDYRVGDIILFTADTALSNATFAESEAVVRGVVTESLVNNPNNLNTAGFTIRILSIAGDIEEAVVDYYIRLVDSEPLFEFKFVRFSYRYKYQDGEYSCFAPFSEIAFIPGGYDYLPKKGYNLGMRNTIKSLKLKNYFPEELISNDVVGIDILYKEDNSPVVYTVKSLTSKDGHPYWTDFQNNAYDRGEYNVTSDVIHAVVPSNQLLRPFDNVPRSAIAQEISANRIIYGNYVQNYNVDDPELLLELHSQDIDNVGVLHAAPSVKTMRTYQVGVVFSDKYGRETPVLTSKNASITVSKNFSTKRNRMFTRLQSDPPSWATHFSFYVKETSSEYYNMAMDRFYTANDGNIWLSFPSSERNKLMEDDYLILKKSHRTNQPVYEKARYKVLAIENEAPDFIKTVVSVIGDCPVGTSPNFNFGNGSGSGYPVNGGTEVWVEESAFNGAFGSDLLIKTPDKMFITLISTEDSSKEYGVMNIRDDGSGKYIIKINGAFGNDMDFTDTDPTTTGPQPPAGLILRLVEHKVENKPEFDGRFFVKIHRDEGLAKYVLSAGDGEDQNYKVLNSWSLRYLNNNGYKGGGSYPITTDHYQALKSEGGSLSGKSHPTEYSHHHTGSPAAAYQWGGTNGKRFDITSSAIHNDPVHALGNDAVTFNGINPKAKEFWEGIKGLKSFFIDCATAYQWSGHEDYIPGDRVNGNTNDGYELSLFMRPDAEQVWYNNNNNFTSSKKSNGTSRSINNSQGAAISRGIWGWHTTPTGDTRCYMDISWSGMENKSTSPWNPPYKHRLQEHSTGVRAAAWKFMEKLVQSGTKFRFRNDPDKIIYETYDYDYQNTPHGKSEYRSNATKFIGAYGIRNFKDDGITGNKAAKKLYRDKCVRQRWTIGVKPGIGSGPSGYNPMTGTINGAPTPVRALKHDADDFDVIEIIEPFISNETKDNFTENPAVWEVEPRESVDLDIYYQASGLQPITLNHETNEQYIPIGSTFVTKNSSGTPTTHTVSSWSGQTVNFTPTLPANTTISDMQTITFIKRRNYWVGSKVNGQVTSGTAIVVHGGPTAVGSQRLFKQYHMLDWANCFSYGNGVETDRIRDSFNEPRFANGVKASTVLAEPVREERRKHGLIFSGIYNSNAGVNNTNQFIAAENITKDLNPVYGSIQKLHTRNTDLITLCEDKVLKVLTKKDALFNADGNANVTSNKMVLGQATAYSGNWGIATNPESFVSTPQQLYFTDITRGQVLAMSREGVRSISDLGMKDYFTDLLRDYADIAIGSYDAKKKEYNITIGKRYNKRQLQPEFTTISYGEKAKGWVSFKSFKPEQGLSLNNEYYTFKNGQLYLHHSNETRNNFYGVHTESDVTVVFNDKPESVKSFGALNYEGSQARITQFTTSNATAYDNAGGSSTVAFNDGEYYNLDAKTGWYVESIITNKQTGNIVEFKEKEGKWFGLIAGDQTNLDNLDETEFSVQGLGQASFSHSNPGGGSHPNVGQVPITWADNVSSTYQGDDGSGGAWDGSLQTAWTCTSKAINYTVGTTVAQQVVNLTISNIVGGSYTGYDLDALDFKIGGATETSSGVFQGGNVDANITQVAFTNNGVAGDPANTVNVAITMPSFTVPTAAAIYYIDIDDDLGAKRNQANRSLCARVHYPFFTNHVITIATMTPHAATVTRTQEDSGSSSGTTKQRYQSSDLVDGMMSQVVQLTFTANSGYYYDGLARSQQNVNQTGYDYTPYYNSLEGNHAYDANGRLTTFSYILEYTPPGNAPLNPDPSNLCRLFHQFNIHFKLVQAPVIPSNQLSSISFSPTAPTTPSTMPVTVSGTVGAQYTLQVSLQQGLSNNNIATSDGYYNFTNNVFQTSSVNSGTQTITAEGMNRHNITIPINNGAKRRFDIIAAGAGSPTTSLATGVPDDHGEASIIQEGVSTLTFTTKTFSGGYTGMVSIVVTRPTGVTTEPTTITTTGGTAGATSTEITLDEQVDGIQAGMVITGIGVPHNTTVVAIKDKRFVTSSGSVAVTDGRTLNFSLNDGNIKAFEITVTPQGDGVLSIDGTGGSRQPNASDFSTGSTVKIDAAGAGTNLPNASALRVTSTVGVGVGMTFVLGSTTHTVNSITSSTALGISPNLQAGLAAGLSIIFEKPTALGVELRHVEAYKDQTSVKIRGLFEITSIPQDDTVEIYLDNFIHIE